MCRYDVLEMDEKNAADGEEEEKERNFAALSFFLFHPLSRN